MAMMQPFLNVIGLCAVLAMIPAGGQPPSCRAPRGSAGHQRRQARKSVSTPPRDRSTQDPAGRTALIRAIDNDDKSAFAAALATPGVDVNARDNWNRTALIHAAAPEADSEHHYGPVKTSRDGRIYEPMKINHHKPSNPRIVAMLIKAGADCSVRDNQGSTPLFHYLRDGASDSNLEVLEALIRCGVSVNAKGSDGKTALMMAAQETRSPAAIAALLKAGAKVDAKDNHGETALMLAANFGQGPAVIVALLKAGADPQAKNNFGQVAYDFALENYSLKGSDVLSRLKPAKK